MEWQALRTRDFARLDPARTVVVAPLAATEQHGPHLPAGTDAMIAAGLLAETGRRLPAGFDVVALPVAFAGASLEHARHAGTVDLGDALLVSFLERIGEAVAAGGLRKLVLVSAHGGNVAAMTAAALRLRARPGILAVHLTWNRLGYPAGLVSDEERLAGAHGGFVETSLMLHFRPDLVDMTAARDFPSVQSALAARFRHLRAYGAVGFGWLAGDLGPDGVTGDAAGASAAAGAAIAAHQAACFADLLAEVSAAELSMLLADG
ncbi:creatininase family protein [Rhizobiales bacterium L72]|uniref:Creatininase family protein n=2 Tax=Propylenella binzhouense TaxID=2555902 RepID=A0A964T4B3_9HYPH|nr:creatininase family protein [Propylenella binzhouense]